MAHCPPYTLASWDCQDRVGALRREGRLGSTWSGQQRASRPRRRSRSSSQCCSQTPTQGDRSGHSHGSSPNMPSRCHCGAPLSPDADTMPKLASAVNVPSYAWSSHSCGGMAQASLDDEDAWEDDFQTQHMPVCHVVQQDGGGRGEPATGRMEASRGSPGWQPCYQVDIGEEKAMLEFIDPTWRATCWPQLAVQVIVEDEVPWYELVIPLTLGADGAALSLAKCLLVAWRWSIKVQQFMTKE